MTAKATVAKPNSKQELQKTNGESTRLPANWPEDITYLPSQTYSSAVTLDNLARLTRTNDETLTWPKIPPSHPALQIPNPTVDIKTIADPQHPAHGERGLFAAQHLPPDTLVTIYIGHVHTNSLSDTDPKSDYDLSYDKEQGLSVDAARAGNEARFANDYRGIGERSNAEFRDCFVQVPSDKRAGGTKWERRVGIFVLGVGKAGKRKGGVREGEEVLINYGKGFWEARKTVAEFRGDAEMRTRDLEFE